MLIWTVERELYCTWLWLIHEMLSKQENGKKEEVKKRGVIFPQSTEHFCFYHFSICSCDFMTARKSLNESQLLIMNLEEVIDVHKCSEVMKTQQFNKLLKFESHRKSDL